MADVILGALNNIQLDVQKDGEIKRSLSTYDMATTPSIVPGSTVITNRTVELIKLGYMHTLQTVIESIPVGTTIDLYLDPTSFAGSYFVLYEIAAKVTDGSAVTKFYYGGDYSASSFLLPTNRNENSSNVATMKIGFPATVNTLGVQAPTLYQIGTESGFLGIGGAGGSSDSFPTEINTSVPRLMRFEHSGGTGTFNLELRLVFAEIP